MEHNFKLPEFGFEATFGKYAKLADNGVLLQQGGTVVLATVVSEPATDFPGFFPLTVDYREQFAAAGRIPGGYMKREGKPTDREVLTSRLIDRSLRPLFPENYFDRVQIVATVYSVDKEHVPTNLALIASSMAVSSSSIPFLGPVGSCEVARVDGEWVFNPTHPQLSESDAKIVVSGTNEGINMVEGTTSEISESDFVDVIFQAHEYIKKQVAWINEISAALKVEKKKDFDRFDWSYWTDASQAFLTQERVAHLFVSDKTERSARRKQLEQDFLAEYQDQLTERNVADSFVMHVFDKVLKHAITQRTFEKNERIDLRDFETVRDVSTEVGFLPYNHGSSLFTRGGTQALTSATLGGGQDEKRVDNIMGEKDKTFMLHYNFLPFSVGEARPMRGPGRREIGHGHLAASALESVLPDREKFSYTIRVVTDILSSDGSSSMATVCGATMALMNAGVPIRKMVSGVAMGLLMNDDGDTRILTDICGIEDAFGLMDFKVAGTESGITALQMDIKYKGGLSRSVFDNALAQAHRGRMHILNEMKTVMSEPREELSDLVPRIVSFKVPQDRIGSIIGPSGKIIREIIEATATTIDIDDDGLVKIFGHPGMQFDKAIAWVKVLGGNINPGDHFEGRVTRTEDYGVFVEIAPNQVGLVHISTIPRAEQDAFKKKYQKDDTVNVEVLDYDASTNRIRLKITE